MKYGSLLHLDFDTNFIKEHKKFDSIVDPIMKMCLNNKSQITCIMSSGDIVVKDLDSSRVLLTVQVPEPLYTDFDKMCRDKPILCCGADNDLIIAFRHFASGRKIHAYNKVGSLLYEINVDDPMYDLVPNRFTLSPGIDLKGRL